jgi:hypothetical protein
VTKGEVMRNGGINFVLMWSGNNAWDYNTCCARACKSPTCGKSTTLHTCRKMTVFHHLKEKHLFFNQCYVSKVDMFSPCVIMYFILHVGKLYYALAKFSIHVFFFT